VGRMKEIEIVKGDLGEQVRAAYRQFKGRATAALEAAIYLGELLSEAKREAGHGNWLTWLQRNCPDLSERTARLYMQLHENREALKTATGVADLTVRAAVELIQEHREAVAPRRAPAIAAPASPPPVRQEPPPCAYLRT
jgi:hypothetical protein